MVFKYRTPVSLAVTAAGDLLLGENDGRHLLKVVNTGANAAEIGVGGNPGATPAWPGFALAAGATWEPVNVPANAIWASSATGTTILAMED